MGHFYRICAVLDVYSALTLKRHNPGTIPDPHGFLENDSTDWHIASCLSKTVRSLIASLVLALRGLPLTHLASRRTGPLPVGQSGKIRRLQ